jgi:hypothetical protein
MTYVGVSAKHKGKKEERGSRKSNHARRGCWKYESGVKWIDKEVARGVVFSSERSFIK